MVPHMLVYFFCACWIPFQTWLSRSSDWLANIRGKIKSASRGQSSRIVTASLALVAGCISLRAQSGLTLEQVALSMRTRGRAWPGRAARIEPAAFLREHFSRYQVVRGHAGTHW